MLFCNTVLLLYDVRIQFLEVRSLCLALFSGNPATVLQLSENAGRNAPEVQPLPAFFQGNPATVLYLSVSDVYTGFLTLLIPCKRLGNAQVSGDWLCGTVAENAVGLLA